MLITKTFMTTIDISDCLEYYTNIDVLIMQKLKARYTKKCCMSMLIISVDKIINRSSMRVATNRLDGSMYVDVDFSVTGIVFIPGEILHNCKIIEIKAQTITAEHEHAIIKLQKTSLPVSDAIFKTLKINQVIPVVVQLTRYMANKPMSTMLATPYIPQPFETIIYSVGKPLDDKQTVQLQELLNMVTDEEKKHTLIKKSKSYMIFSEIMYPYMSKQQFTKGALYTDMEFKPVDFEIKSISEITSGSIVFPSEDQPNYRFFHGKKTNATVMSVYTAVASYVNKYLVYLQTLRGFVETYPETSTHTKELANYLSICKRAKQ